MTELSALPLAERLERYRELREFALREAKRSHDETAEAFLLLAEAWARLAEITERLISQRATWLSENGPEEKEAALRAPPKRDEREDPES